MTKLTLPATIFLVSIVLGGFTKAGLERQQTIKTAQDRQEYIGKRKMECYEILERERSKENDRHNSVAGAKYYEPTNNPYDATNFSDTCRVEYLYRVSNPDGITEMKTEYINY